MQDVIAAENLLPYQKLSPLDGNLKDARIFSPFGYRLVRECQIAPVVHSEAMRLAIWFPVVWQKDGPSYRLVVLRSLLRDGRGITEDAARNLESLPHLLFAFPLAVRNPHGDPAATKLGFDNAMCDEPTDIGSMVWDAQGNMTPGADLRRIKLTSFMQDARTTGTLSQALAQKGLLQPWPIEMDVGGTSVRVDGLFCVNPSVFTTPDLAGLLDRFGAGMAELLAAHRLSLYRINWLRAAARRAMAQPARLAP